ncbi:hypothetical protein BN440_2812 [Erwinia amylovora MR1]|nr:hypothetical protein BN440_2812 [Erwinia amylovora MR1]
MTPAQWRELSVVKAVALDVVVISVRRVCPAS